MWYECVHVRRYMSDCVVCTYVYMCVCEFSLLEFMLIHRYFVVTL